MQQLLNQTLREVLGEQNSFQWILKTCFLNWTWNWWFFKLQDHFFVTCFPRFQKRHRTQWKLHHSLNTSRIELLNIITTHQTHYIMLWTNLWKMHTVSCIKWHFWKKKTLNFMKRIGYLTNVVELKKHNYDMKELSLYKMRKICNLKKMLRSRYKRKNIFRKVKREEEKRAKNVVENATNLVIMRVPVILM